MAVGREIKTKIKSVKNTQKITRAMELVAASKMRKARDRMEQARPYANYAKSLIAHVAKAHLEYEHAYFQTREVKRVGIIIVSTERGLCGGLNINLFKSVLNKIQDFKEKNIEIDVSIIGAKAESFFKRLDLNIVSLATKLGDQPSVKDLIGSVKVMLDAYDNKKIDQLLLFSNEFVNTISQKPTIAQLLPIVADEQESLNYHWDYIYEPEARDLLEMLVVRYVESQVYRGVIENIGCEQASRMMAMKSATDNAGAVINELNLKYNKARQAAITQEISEIVSGAAAV
ncbi:F0F1 ATP synthase subunit gamma [Thiotrichales bacterium 19S11-10]|nr:F0F1 ATP synthase subunit gamma [Thiotrichales bacterium 19S11-10]MCF6807548.1 F0F1 ATP synthase subunit gamma [Thiotrichales bacterium 19S9-11]MCF6811517.1 F0F1 ATP synthase subunit gamma [Thiotrichales bacterium 19S9-12]